MVLEWLAIVASGLAQNGGAELFQAVRAGDPEGVARLLDGAPALAAARNENGVSAPLFALYLGKRELAELLLEKKEAVSELDVFEAAAFGRRDRLGALLDENPSLANAYASDGFFPLGLAAFFGREETVRFLLAHGAETELAAQNPMNVRAIHAAAASGNLAVARALLEAGADPNAAQEGGFRPLHEAAMTGRVELAELLLEHGADPEARTADGKTALDLARDAKQDAVLAVLARRSVR